MGRGALLRQFPTSGWFALSLVLLVHNSAERQAFPEHKCGLTAESLCSILPSRQVFIEWPVCQVWTREDSTGSWRAQVGPLAGHAGAGACRGWSPQLQAGAASERRHGFSTRVPGSGLFWKDAEGGQTGVPCRASVADQGWEWRRQPLGGHWTSREMVSKTAEVLAHENACWRPSSVSWAGCGRA